MELIHSEVVKPTYCKKATQEKEAGGYQVHEGVPCPKSGENCLESRRQLLGIIPLGSKVIKCAMYYHISDEGMPEYRPNEDESNIISINKNIDS
jgi:hypothetical protein